MSDQQIAQDIATRHERGSCHRAFDLPCEPEYPCEPCQKLIKAIASALSQARAEEREGLRVEIDAAWFGIEHGYDIESRAELEKAAKTNGFKYGLAQAVHHIWKREPKVEVLTAAHERLREALAASRDVLVAFQKEAGYLPQQQGYSTRMTDGEHTLARAVASIDNILAESVLASPEGMRTTTEEDSR